MKKIFAAVIAVILVVSALCVVSSAGSEDGEDEFSDSGIVLHVGDVVLFYDSSSYYSKDYYEQYKDYDPDDGDPFDLKDPVPEPYYDLPSYDVLGQDEFFCAVNSDCISVNEVVSGCCYVITCLSPGTFNLYYHQDEFCTYYTAVIENSRSGSFIASFLSGLTEIFAGLAKGFAGVSVNAADSLILTSDGSLTSFAQLGIFGIGLALVAGVVGLLARRFRR